jgi:hypothetical protein
MFHGQSECNTFFLILRVKCEEKTNFVTIRLDRKMCLSLTYWSNSVQIGSLLKNKSEK